jgi:hypothetical protein
MTDSERKRAQRTRDRRAAIDAIGDEQNAHRYGHFWRFSRALKRRNLPGILLRRAWAEIGRRYGFVTITK